MHTDCPVTIIIHLKERVITVISGYGPVRRLAKPFPKRTNKKLDRNDKSNHFNFLEIDQISTIFWAFIHAWALLNFRQEHLNLWHSGLRMLPSVSHPHQTALVMWRFCLKRGGQRNEKFSAVWKETNFTEAVALLMKLTTLRQGSGDSQQLQLCEVAWLEWIYACLSLCMCTARNGESSKSFSHAWQILRICTYE